MTRQHCAGRCVLQARPMHVHGHHWMRVRGGCSFAVAACEYDHIHILTGGVPHHVARCRWCLDEGSCVPTEYLHNCAAQTTCSDLSDCEGCVASSCCEFVVSLRLGPVHGLWVRHASTPCAGTALRRRLASLQRTRALAMASKCPPATPRCVELSHCAICTWGRWAKRCQLSACHCSYTCCQLHHQVCLRWGFLVWVRCHLVCLLAAIVGGSMTYPCATAGGVTAPASQAGPSKVVTARTTCHAPITSVAVTARTPPARVVGE